MRDDEAASESRKKGRKTRSESAKRANEQANQAWIWRFRCSISFARSFLWRWGKRCDWSDEDADEFWHDLELYENLTAHEARRQQGRSDRAIASGPFVDRVALLLDPSLMDQARRAAGKFQMELNAAADRVLRKDFLPAPRELTRTACRLVTAALRERC